MAGHVRNLCVITPYFNYYGAPYVLDNYRRFRASMADEGVPLLTVEAILEGQKSVIEGDDVLRLKSHSVIWQKERMINAAIQHLGGLYKNVAWVDSDIMLTPGWSEELIKILDQCRAVQLFSQVHYLDQSGMPEDALDGIAVDFEVGQDVAYSRKWSAHGGAWAAPVEVLDGLGLYDAWVSSGNDTLFAAAACCVWQEVRLAPDALEEHYRAWAIPITERIGGKVRCLNSACRHLYHGEIMARGYGERSKITGRWGFDPVTDIYVNTDGLYEWATKKVGLHRDIKSIFMKSGRVPVHL